MQCETCKRELTKLFLTQACDYCDYGVPKDRLYVGFALYWADRPNVEEYIFRAPSHAAQWRVASGRAHCEIRQVYSLIPFRWHESRGTLNGMVLADHMHQIFPDHRFEPLPHRVFLAEEKT